MIGKHCFNIDVLFLFYKLFYLFFSEKLVQIKRCNIISSKIVKRPKIVYVNLVCCNAIEKVKRKSRRKSTRKSRRKSRSKSRRRENRRSKSRRSKSRRRESRRVGWNNQWTKQHFASTELNWVNEHNRKQKQI